MQDKIPVIASVKVEGLEVAVAPIEVAIKHFPNETNRVHVAHVMHANKTKLVNLVKRVKLITQSILHED